MKLISRFPIIMIVVGVLGISLSAILVRYSTAPSSVTAVWRLIWTVVLMVPYVLAKPTVRQELVSIKAGTVLRSALSGVFLAVHFWLWFESLQHTSIASSTILVNTEVIWVAIGYFLFMKGNVTRREVGAIAITLVGSFIVAAADRSSTGSALWGDILSLVAALACGIYVLIGRSVRKSGISTSSYTFITYFACMVGLLVIVSLQGYSIFSYGWNSILIGLGLAVFPTFLGHTAFSWCLLYFSPSFVSASKLCEPVFTTILAIVLFGEIPYALQIAGGIIIIAGILIYSRIEASNKEQ